MKIPLQNPDLDMNGDGSNDTNGYDANGSVPNRSSSSSPVDRARLSSLRYHDDIHNGDAMNRKYGSNGNEGSNGNGKNEDDSNGRDHGNSKNVKDYVNSDNNWVTLNSLLKELKDCEEVIKTFEDEISIKRNIISFQRQELSNRNRIIVEQKQTIQKNREKIKNLQQNTRT